MYFRLQRADQTKVENPAAYLFRMALNLARDHQRERQRSQMRDGNWVDATQDRLGGDQIALSPPADAVIDAKQRLQAVLAALDELSPQCRRVFTLHKFDGLSHAEISEKLGIARSTVEKHMTTALKHLLKRRDQSAVRQ